MNDDRQEFLAHRVSLLAGLGTDSDVSRSNNELLVASDRHGYSYLWDWLGVPIIQSPADIVAMQEIVWRTKPDIIVETGVARGGSAILHSSLLALTGKLGLVVAIDIDIRAHNRDSIESHPQSANIRLIEGSSIEPSVLAQVRSHIEPRSKVMVVLDSNHTHEHVLAELVLYSELVTSGMYLVVADTVVEELPVQEHRPRPWGPGDNPKTAIDEFVKSNSNFSLDQALATKMLMSSSAAGYLLRK